MPTLAEKMAKHEKLMSEMPYPHAGWAECKCNLADSIRTDVTPRKASESTLAEKIKALVREEFPCEREGEEACAYNFGEPMPGHDLMCPARFANEALAACYRAANLALEAQLAKVPHLEFIDGQPRYYREVLQHYGEATPSDCQLIGGRCAALAAEKDHWDDPEVEAE